MMKRLSERMRSNLDSEVRDSAPEAKELQTPTSRHQETESETARWATERHQQRLERVRRVQLKKMYRTPCQRMQRVGDCATFLDAKDERQNVIGLDRLLGIDKRGQVAFSHLRARVAEKFKDR